MPEEEISSDEDLAVVDKNIKINDLQLNITSGGELNPICPINKLSRRQKKKITAVQKKNATRGVPVINLDNKSAVPAYEKVYTTRKGDRAEKTPLLQTNEKNEASETPIVKEHVSSGSDNTHNSQHGVATRSRKLLALATTGSEWINVGSKKNQAS